MSSGRAKNLGGSILNAVQDDAYIRMGQLADWKGRIIPVPRERGYDGTHGSYYTRMEKHSEP